MFRTSFGASSCTRLSNTWRASLCKPRTFSSNPRLCIRFTPPSRARYVRFDESSTSGSNSRRTDLWGRRFGVGFLVVGAVYYIAHLEQVPETGRWRYMDVDPKRETELAEEVHAQILKENKGKILPANHPLTQVVRDVAQQLLHANDLGYLSDERVKRAHSLPAWLSGQSDVYDTNISSQRDGLAPGTGGREWKVVVIHDPRVVNAAATYVSSPSEMGHVVARHVSERYSLANWLLLAATFITTYTPLSFPVVDLMMTLVFNLPMSRSQELEADKIGLELAAKACYDPAGAISMFEKFEMHSRSHPGLIEFLQTHPSHVRRIERMKTLLPEAYAVQAATPECAQVQDMAYAMQNFS
ncbi:hypothetical protein NEOLEDRAFT_1153467 [Neolentinus lepideus HHB14362 ss-1]|uniref:F5/8 type C domain-containing protein n=1 Tax=Neolentinus lepideus HHB14362 ss-1 TaxID=1314782 RepID=A0A165VSC3_9AGAM|nr:hypothetical protein NEOLEDRAFT_1153467 [Neolentinus lepideus HHB14362 ss-1]